MISKIIDNKKKEVENNKKVLPLDILKYKLGNSKRDFKQAISKNKMNLIAEIKKKSPSNNIQNKEFNFERIIDVYNKHADAISVLTDSKFFDGNLNDIKKVRDLTNLPILRKDFIIDEYQIYESRFYGADAILLIASVLSKNQISFFSRIARNYNMDCLVEVHTEEELIKVMDTGAEIIGINNRNLDTLNIDTNTTLKLLDKIPKNKVVVSESGISSNTYIKQLSGKVSAVLVGTLFMNSTNPEKEIVSLIQ
ncbi:indole-3-glycerol phosphate synthase [Candidatus Woesearchaeota archaeon]|jgi:indole-3-glycerol phosphate synthase|nr:indole-3-glycerol phosphate synthase [Candidatus Woesearchaeota archaeon]MDP6647922.1 indole-3-glycerol phosphate synthase TrpC [Candidatus Woesearchaeota archaeon]|tara:strand:- start:12099 stop:12854 length:756 start_codon:yes stop_codon:yes gene_type:complete